MFTTTAFFYEENLKANECLFKLLMCRHRMKHFGEKNSIQLKIGSALEVHMTCP